MQHTASVAIWVTVTHTQCCPTSQLPAQHVPPRSVVAVRQAVLGAPGLARLPARGAREPRVRRGGPDAAAARAGAVQVAARQLPPLPQARGASSLHRLTAAHVLSVVAFAAFAAVQDMQPTFSFNLRGAYNKIANLTQAQRAKGIVACAAGNHLEGVAYAAAKLDVDAIVIAPVGTAQNISHSTKSKITIVEHGADFEASLVRGQTVKRCCCCY
ncbi:hypothetical protein ON010_g10541 [Phytophthora cinnamomi]|nr:hypothetical protein ON010_g10541 [Phytophthora cinnamomi]